MAAWANARMPSVHLSRHIHCEKTPNLGIPSVLIVLKDPNISTYKIELPPEGRPCLDFPVARIYVFGLDYPACSQFNR